MSIIEQMDLTYRESAEEQGKARLAEIEQIMGQINTELDKYRSLIYWHYGHSGDLGWIVQHLSEVWEFVAGAE